MALTLSETKQWTPPDRLKIKKEPGFGYKYFRKDEVERRLDEGWEICYKGERADNEAKPLDGAQHYRSLILMRMPTDQVKLRNKHYIEKHQRRIRAIGAGARLQVEADRVNKEAGLGLDSRDAELTGVLGKGFQSKTKVFTDEGLVHTNEVDGSDKDTTPEDIEELNKVRERQEKDDLGESESEEADSPQEPKRRKYKKSRR